MSSLALLSGALFYVNERADLRRLIFVLGIGFSFLELGSVARIEEQRERITELGATRSYALHKEFSLDVITCPNVVYSI